MKPELKMILVGAVALIDAHRDELRERCADTTAQKFESLAVELQSVITDSATEPATPAAPAPLDVAALAASIAATVTEHVLAALPQPTATTEPAPAA